MCRAKSMAKKSYSMKAMLASLDNKSGGKTSEKDALDHTWCSNLSAACLSDANYCCCKP